MKAAIISVGTELLMGDIVNTNAAYLAKALSNRGIRILHHYTVGDNFHRLTRIIDEALKDHDILVFTGGLGPTEDDLTRETVAQSLGWPLVFQEEIWQTILSYLGRKNQADQVAVNNKRQAMVPQGAQILANPIGTAPGLYCLTQAGQHLFLLPGPPREMKTMFNNQVLPILEKFDNQELKSTYVRFFGIGESALELEIKDLMQQTNPTLALYAKDGEVMLRITAAGDSQATCQALIEETLIQVLNRLGDYIYLIGDQDIADAQTKLPDVIADALIRNQITISTAESLTGGSLASQLVNIAGISAVFWEGIIAYNLEAKERLLGVDRDLLQREGAVHPEVAEQMIKGLLAKTSCQAAIATTGIAGPGSDEHGRPVGLVYIATALRGQIQVKSYQLYGDRDMVRYRACLHAFNQLRLMLIDQGYLVPEWDIR
ncbi:TPA: competence/damage-inducible protein A [Streptococcus suis]